MVTAASLQDQLKAKVKEVSDIVSGLSEEQASKPTDGDWCVKELLSHLAGDETAGFIAGMKRFVTEDEPTIIIERGVTFFDQRKSETVAQLLADVQSQYDTIGNWVASLTPEQLERKARIPLLAETPLGENVSLGTWVGALINYHLPDHINQLREMTK